MVNAAPGILAIWNDVAPGRDGDFNKWFQGEHLEERLAVPGFLYGRRHQAISGASGYFNFYLVESPDVLTSQPYLERLNNPTPMTRMIMSEVFKNMNRTLCHRSLRRGAMRGAYVVTVRFNDAPDEKALAVLLSELLSDINIVSGEIWTAVDVTGQPLTQEEKLRGGDRKIKGALMVDTLRQADAEALGAQLTKQFPKGDTGVFRVLCQLGHGEAFAT
jgi:hypothetical protein